MGSTSAYSGQSAALVLAPIILASSSSLLAPCSSNSTAGGGTPCRCLCCYEPRIGTEERETEEGTDAGERELFRGIWAHMVEGGVGREIEREREEGDADGDGDQEHEAD